MKRPRLFKPILTFSFDDAHPNDLKIAALLKKYSLKATFYIPILNPENSVMKPIQVRKLRSMGFEIGSHGLTHRRLPRISMEEARQEVFLSKKKLEKITGTKIKAYCFAGGKYEKRHEALPVEAGYLFSRTTRLLRLYNPIEGPLMHTTQQYYPLSTLGYLKHLVRRPNTLGYGLFASSIIHCGMNPSPNRLAKYFIDLAVRDKACFHLHGHSYEFQTKENWEGIEELLEYAGAQKQGVSMTNTEAFRTMSAQNDGHSNG